MRYVVIERVKPASEHMAQEKLCEVQKWQPTLGSQKHQGVLLLAEPLWLPVTHWGHHMAQILLVCAHLKFSTL